MSGISDRSRQGYCRGCQRVLTLEGERKTPLPIKIACPGAGCGGHAVLGPELPQERWWKPGDIARAHYEDGSGSEIALFTHDHGWVGQKGSIRKVTEPLFYFEKIEVDPDRLRRIEAERQALRETMFVLAAPLCYATDGGTHSLIYNLRTYVEKLEAQVKGEQVPETQHRPTAFLQADVFPSESIRADERQGDLDDYTAEEVAIEAWSNIQGWVDEGYMPILTVLMPDGSSHLIDTEEATKETLMRGTDYTEGAEHA